MGLTLKIFLRLDDELRFIGEQPLDTEAVTLGRSQQCTIPLEDPQRTLSRTHLSIEPVQGRWLMRVLSKNYGVVVNGKEHGPGAEVLVKAGDCVAMDKYELEFAAVPDAAVEPDLDPEATVAVRRSAPSPMATSAVAPSLSRAPESRPRESVPPAVEPVPAPPAPAAVVMPVSIPAGLSATRLADLPGANPYQTVAGTGGESVQIASLQTGHVLAGRFRVGEQIGAGGMGAVYRAHDELRGEDIALKVMLPGLLASEQAKQRFMNEAKIALKLRHPGIVSVHDVQADGAYLFLTMELLRGRTLRAAMEERKQASKPWSEAEALAVIGPLCEALGYAHQHTVHRDIKPENVWLCEDGAVKLMDFGIARVLSGNQMTQTAAVMGTAYYMAPEQLVGLPDVDHRADQYSVAVMLYEMLTGRVPAGRVESLVEARTDVTQGVSDAVDRALSGRAEQRFQSDEEFLAALRTPVARKTATTIRALERRTGLSSGRARQFGIAAAVAAGIAVLALAWPLAKALLPDREAERKADMEAARLEAEARSLLKLIDSDRRDLKEAAATAARDVERIEGQVRSARTPAERTSLETALREARDKASLNADLERKMRDRAEGGGGVPKAEGAMNAAAAAVKAKERTEALRLLNEAVAALTAIREGAAADRKGALEEQARLAEKRQKEEQALAEQRRQEEQRLAEARAKADAKARAEAKAREEQLAREKEVADARARAENAARARTEAEARARAEADARVRAEASERDRAERAERDRQERAERAARARAEAEARAKAEERRQGLETFMGIMRGFAR